MATPTPETATYEAAAAAIQLVMSCDDDAAIDLLHRLDREALVSVRAAASILAGLTADIQEQRRAVRTVVTVPGSPRLI